MRVCFVMAALPHYFKLVLNKLTTNYDIELILIKPSQASKSLGSGVKEDKDNIAFKLIELEEYTTWYGKSFFKDLIPTLQNIEADIVVMSSWPYFLHFVLNPFFYFQFKKLRTKLICRDIPFNVPIWGKAYTYYFSNQNLTEDFSTDKKTLKGFIALWGLSVLRKVYLNIADAHINYIDEAYEIIGSYGVPKEKIFITANSPDTDELLAANDKVKTLPPILPQNPYRLIHVGRLVKWKRVDLIIEALKNLEGKYPEIELIVIGYGPAETELKVQTQFLGLEKKVKFIGGIYETVELGRYLHSSSIYVLAGMGGLSINDAMCFEKPVVCSMADGTEKRLVREGQNGYYFENGNAESLTEVLDSMLSDPEKVEKFSKESLRIIEEEINIHSVLDGYMKAFKFLKTNTKP